MLRQLVANQILENILTDTKMHFESQLRRVVQSLLESEQWAMDGSSMTA